MSLGIAHLIVIDVMAIGVAMLRGDALQEHLKLINKTLNHGGQVSIKMAREII